MRKRQLIALFFGALAVGARLPFLVTGKIPFDSDEAVEGLMARHVLTGELPAFFWGQAFKGVPEVYASAGAFAIFGSSVVILKAVTLMFFAAFIVLNFILLDSVASRWLAVSSSLLLIGGPPALVFWSLDASAEYVLIMLLGTALLLLCRPFTDRREPGAGTRRLLAIGLVVGTGLWVHQLFAVYLIPLGILLSLRGEWLKVLWSSRPHRFAVALAAVAGIYIVLGVLAFVSGGFVLQIGSATISATAPQKMARIALAILVLAAMVQTAASTSSAQLHRSLRRYWPAAVGLVIGYSPALLYSLLVEPARSPARVANLRQLVAAAPDMFGNIVPILAGFKVPPTTERLPLPAIAAVPLVTALLAFLWSSRRRLLTDFYALFVVFYPLLFLASGAYLDTQSYRYFIPWYAGSAVALAAGSLALARKQTASIIVAAIVSAHVWQQAAWYRKLQPDTQSLATIECLKRNGIRGGYAEYWTAYKLTFLAREAIIVAPTDGIDRYPRYTEYVKALPAHEQVRLKADNADCMEASPP